ncbi:alpha/beta fold hydrolase [Rhodococcus wratislaviensis]|uniref:alpha/beta fold hydrolase n=1 Tax=Rhodococcus wratislaviensis TaxID=44752 RepID=UPI0035147DED
MTDTTEPDHAEPHHVVLLPGMLCTEQLWAGVVTQFPRRARIHHAVLERNSISSIANNILASAPPKFTVIGLSLGGIVAMHLATVAPQRITGLALLSTNARSPRPDQFRGWQEAATRLDNGASAVSEQQRLLSQLVSTHSLTADPTLASRVLAMAQDTGEERLRAQLHAQESRIDYSDALRHIRCPSLVLAAEQDALCGVQTMRDIAAQLPESRFEIVPESGHLSPLERPDTIGHLLSRWLTDTRKSEPTETETEADAQPQMLTYAAH